MVWNLATLAFMVVAIVFCILWARSYKALTDEQMFQQDIIDVAQIPIVLLQGNKIVYANQACADFLGAYSRETLVGNVIEQWMTQESKSVFDNDASTNTFQVVRYLTVQFQTQQKGIRISEINLMPMYFNRKIVQRMSIEDKTEEVLKFQNVEQMAFHDALTGLPNRAMFKEVMKKHMQERIIFGLMMLDLDHFKQINDTLGHNAGDALLKGFADRLSQCVRGHDVVCRLAGDEFVIVLPYVRSPSDAEQVAQRIVYSMQSPFVLEGMAVNVTTSIGVTFVGDWALSLDEIVKQADSAMYVSKQNGKNQYSVYRV